MNKYDFDLEDVEFDLGEYYDELENLIANSKDQGVISVDNMLKNIDFLKEITHRNTKKAMKYAAFVKYQNKLKKIFDIYEHRGCHLRGFEESPIKSVDGKMIKKTPSTKKMMKKAHASNKKALRRELKNIDIDIANGSSYKNIRGRKRQLDGGRGYASRHIHARNRFKENDSYCQIHDFPNVKSALDELYYKELTLYNLMCIA